DPDLLSGGVAQALTLGAAPAQLRNQRVLRLVFADETIDLPVPHIGDPRDEIADAVAVRRPPELNLRLQPVAARHRDLAHVHAAEANDLQPARLRHGARDA